MARRRLRPSPIIIGTAAIAVLIAAGAVWNNARQNRRLAQSWDHVLDPDQRGWVGTDADGNFVYFDADGKVVLTLPPNE
jgi:hypothetical protein